MADKLGLIVCETIAGDIREALRGLETADLDVVIRPLRCGWLAPNPAGLEEAKAELKTAGRPSQTFGAYCHFSSTARAAACPEDQIASCYDLLAGPETTARLKSEGAILVNAGWLADWEGRLREAGFEATAAKNAFGDVSKVVLIDTGRHPEAADRLREFGAFLDRPTEILWAGLDILRGQLQVGLLAWRLRKERRKTADLTMAVDLIDTLAQARTEHETVGRIEDLFRLLFAPRRLTFRLSDSSSVPDGETGALIPIGYGDVVYGQVEMGGFAFPEYTEHYRTLSAILARVSGLAMSNARAYETIRDDRDRIGKLLASTEALLAQRELLMRELNHRVKNNFQILASLVSLQAQAGGAAAGPGGFRELRDRIRSMARVHERLYKSDDLVHVDFGLYIQSLAKDLFQTYQIAAGRITLRVESGEVKLNAHTAIPLSLILNELISNSLKHAFPEDRPGTIFVSLAALGDKRYELLVRDDGVGWPGGADPPRHDSLGLILVNTLAGQLNGTAEMDGRSGASTRVRFEEVTSRLSA